MTPLTRRPSENPACIPYPPTGASVHLVLYDAGSTGSLPNPGFGQVSMNYNLVSFTSLPEPGTFVAALLGQLALAAREKDRESSAEIAHCA